MEISPFDFKRKGGSVNQGSSLMYLSREEVGVCKRHANRRKFGGRGLEYSPDPFFSDLGATLVSLA